MKKGIQKEAAENILDMTEGSPYSLLLRFSLPLVLGNLFQQFYTFADTIIVGQKLGIQALAALGAAEWLNFLLFGFIQGITQGFSICVSKYYGEKNKNLLQQGIFHAVFLSICAAVLFTVLGQAALGAALTMLRTPDELYPMAYRYLRILYLGIPVSFAYNMSAALLRAFGNSKAPLYAMVAASLLNIVFDILFVMYFGMGIQGAAYGTLLAQVFSVIYCMAVFHKIEQAKVESGNRKISRGMLWEQLKLGIPMGIQNIITAAGGLVVQSVVNGFGMLFIAGYTAANKLYALLEIAASSYGYGISTYAAQNIGAGEKDRIRMGMKAAVKIGIVTAYLMSLIMLVFGNPILGLFISGVQKESEAAITVGYQFLCILAVFFPFLYLLYIIRACIQGMGNSVIPMLSSLIQVFMRVICAVIVTGIIGKTGVFWGEIMAWLGADGFLFFMLRKLYLGKEKPNKNTR